MQWDLCHGLPGLLFLLVPAAAALAQQDAPTQTQVEPPEFAVQEPEAGLPEFEAQEAGAGPSGFVAQEPEGSDAAADDAAPAPSPRARYNLALDELGSGEIEDAVEGFLAARDEAGADVELRYRSAFNLGVALASQADTEQPDAPERAIETLRTSAAWFNDAIRLAPGADDDARVNLEIVLRRIQQLADQLNQGNRLEARLDRTIDDQRGLRDSVRRLYSAIESEGAGAEPVGFQREFEELATLERTLLAEAGSIGDLAAEERSLIEAKNETERTDQERMRAFALDGMNRYLQQARQSLSDARRRLRRLEAERAHDRAEGALAELKRAREQLLDPITVLKRVAQDQTLLLTHTQALALLRGGNLRLDTRDQAAAVPPAWLNAEHLGNRQDDVSARTGEVLARFGAGAEDQATEPPPDASPEQRRLFEAVREAVPLLQSALAAMRDIEVSLATAALASAAESGTEALRMLYRAIERFAGLRDLIELAYADQTQAVTLLTPGGDGAPIAELTTEERARAVAEAADSNLDRLDRLEGLFADERAAAESEAATAEQGGQAEAEGLQAVLERYDLAEQLRGTAAAALEDLSAVLADVVRGAEAAEPLGPATEALTSIEELRRLFFSVVEHLQELLAAQADTYDRTAALGISAAADELGAELGLAAERQDEQARTADSLAQVLVEQADASGAAGAAGTAPEQPPGEQLSAAAEEVRAAAGSMQAAGVGLADATERADSASPDLEPILSDQLEAMAHLENAIRLLQPPQQQQNQGDGQDEQQQQQQEQRRQEEEMTQRQALSRLQAIRDREAERRRNREQQPVQRQPVENDF
ncbi:hypothetical protein [Candidatus Rariloculus sp.]|uniref:hypothetical protein n=1 Tax=Candidatus Rariloculus sp. TaxID=3101265 RepID=UPI003D13115A